MGRPRGNGGEVNWGSWREFLAMGGYALYVWGAYVVTAAALVVEMALLRRRRRHALEGVSRYHSFIAESPREAAS